MWVQEMTWNWTVKGDSLGTPTESAVKASWPDYNSAYLTKKLANDVSADASAYTGIPRLDEVQRGVYLTEAIKGYEGEAEACLKAEFEQWLQGIHPENLAARNDNEGTGLGQSYYRNGKADEDGGPRRRHVYEGDVATEIKDDKNGTTGWQATRWGTKQLTNLEGVREFLREGKIARDNAERDMNILAERGPQDLNEAWMYFKHWVKRRPVSSCDVKGPPGWQNEERVNRDGKLQEMGRYTDAKALTKWKVDRVNGTGPRLSLMAPPGLGIDGNGEIINPTIPIMPGESINSAEPEASIQLPTPTTKPVDEWPMTTDLMTTTPAIQSSRKDISGITREMNFATGAIDRARTVRFSSDPVRVTRFESPNRRFDVSRMNLDDPPGPAY